MPKQNDVLQQYSAMRAALQRERDRLEDRIKQINSALGASGESSSSPVAAARTVSRKTRTSRPENSMNIREAIARVTANKPLSIRDIVDAVGKIGYKFASSNPVNSVGAYLYGAGKKEFKRANGKFAAK